MAQFLYTAKHPSGRNVTDSIDAQSIEGARLALQLLKYDDIIFHTDAASAHLHSRMIVDMGVPNLTRRNVKIELSSMRQGGAMRFVRSALKSHLPIIGGLLVWCLFVAKTPRSFTASDWAVIAVTGSYLVYVAAVVFPGAAFQAFLYASLWDNERSARAWARALKGFRRIARYGVANSEIDFRLANLLTRAGKHEEAHSIIRPYETAAQSDPYLLSRVAGFWDEATQYEKALSLRKQALDCRRTGSFNEVIDYALELARYHGRADEAEAALASVDQRILGDIGRLFVKYVQGLIALTRQQYPVSDQLLTETEGIIGTFGTNLLMQGILREVWAFHVLALAGLGQFETARMLFEQARPMLEARHKHALLERCRVALAPGPQ